VFLQQAEHFVRADWSYTKMFGQGGIMNRLTTFVIKIQKFAYYFLLATGELYRPISEYFENTISWHRVKFQ